MIRCLWMLLDGRDWLWGKLSLLLMGGAILSKSLIQFSLDGQGCVPSLLFDLRPNYGGGNGYNSDLLQKVLCRHGCAQCSWPCSRPLPTHASAGDSWTLTGKCGSVSCWVTAPFFWVLVCTRCFGFFCFFHTRQWSRRTCTHVLLRELQNYNSLLNNHWEVNVGSHYKKLPHIQRQRRSPSKMVRGAKSLLESNPIPPRDAHRAQTKLCVHQDPETPQRLTYLSLSV